MSDMGVYHDVRGHAEGRKNIHCIKAAEMAPLPADPIDTATKPVIVNLASLAPNATSSPERSMNRADGCVADHGAQIGSSVCCGQNGSVRAAFRICPASAPICHGFLHGSQWGACQAIKVAEDIDESNVSAVNAATRDETVVNATPACEDRDDECSRWASIGECSNNPGYMLDNCQISCGVCGSTAGNATVTPPVSQEVTDATITDTQSADATHLKQNTTEKLEKSNSSTVNTESNTSVTEDQQNATSRGDSQLNTTEKPWKSNSSTVNAESNKNITKDANDLQNTTNPRDSQLNSTEKPWKNRASTVNATANKNITEDSRNTTSPSHTQPSRASGNTTEKIEKSNASTVNADSGNSTTSRQHTQQKFMNEIKGGNASTVNAKSNNNISVDKNLQKESNVSNKKLMEGRVPLVVAAQQDQEPSASTTGSADAIIWPDEKSGAFGVRCFFSHVVLLIVAVTSRLVLP